MQWLLRLSIWLQENAAGAEGAAPESAPAPASDGLTGMLPMLFGVLVIFYFLAWRPQAKERRAREELMKSIKKGDRVITNSGLYGTVAALAENEITLKVDDKNNVRLRFSRQAIQNVLRDPEPEPSGESES